MDFHQSVAERHTNLVLKFAYLKNLDDVDLFNIIGLDRREKSKQVKKGKYVITLIIYKNNFVLNGKLVKIYLILRKGVACNTMFS